MSTLPLSDAKARLLEMERESVAAIFPAYTGGVTYFPYFQEAFPYWMNRLANSPIDYEASDIMAADFRIDAYLVIAHLTAGYQGEGLESMDEIIPAVLEYFAAHDRMTTAISPTPFPYLAPEGFGIDSVEEIIIQNSATGTKQMALKFAVSMPLEASVY